MALLYTLSSCRSLTWWRQVAQLRRGGGATQDQTGIVKAEFYEVILGSLLSALRRVDMRTVVGLLKC